MLVQKIKCCMSINVGKSRMQCICLGECAHLHVHNNKQSAFPKRCFFEDVNIIQSVYAYSVHMFCVPHLKQFLL